MIEVDTLTARPLFSASVAKTSTDETFRRFVTTAGARAGDDAKVLGVGRTRSTTDKELVPVDIAGIVLVEAGGVIAADAAIASDAMGRAKAGAANSPGRALTAAAAAGDTIAALIGIG